MAALVWDNIEDRIFESGLDRGVIYLLDGTAVPWNGLVSVSESSGQEVTPVYYEGRKINNLVVPGDFTASVKAITYPDEFSDLEGFGTPRDGVLLDNQIPKMFHLCYRTQVGTVIDGQSVHHKIHIVYNALANPKDKSYETLSDSPNLVEFEWDITAIPEDIDGYRPTAHIVLDSRTFDPWLIEDLEAMLYGSETAPPSLLPLQDLVDFIMEWRRINIIDNGDGTWTAYSSHPDYISVDGDVFTITNANAEFIDPDTYTISDTVE